jgi:ectoine hydroxylase-related dioxygenase (phytanoyl-CoA dioxygenase family)
VSSLKDNIRQTGRSPIFRVSWSEAQLAELRNEGARQIQLAATDKEAQFDLHLLWPKLLDLVTDPVILARHSEVFAEGSFQLVETRLYPKPPQSGPAWHIDRSQLLHFQPSLLHSNSDDFHSVTTWLALADVPAEMGPIQFIHYKRVNVRRLVRMRKNRAADGYWEACKLEAERLHDHIETLPMKAGEFCMFDPRNLHTGAANRTNQFRLGMVLRYCASHVKVASRFSKKGNLEILQIRNGRVSRPAGDSRC